MNKQQKYTPKYWVGYNKLENDIFITSAAKDMSTAQKWMEECYGEDWFLDDRFEVVLVEINLLSSPV